MTYQFRIAYDKISEIIPENIGWYLYAYKDEYLKLPIISAEWIKIAHKFEVMWQFSYLGEIDGKQVWIMCLKHSGSVYFDYKDTCI